MASVLQEHIHLRFTRFSAFYTPLLLTLKSKDLKGSGIKLTYDRATPALSVDAGLADGSVHVAQSAPALSFKSALSGQPPAYRHFALMNNRDGFFLAARKGSTAAVQQPQPGSTAAVQGPAPGTWQWGNLEGSTALIDHFFQPLALFRIALRCQGVDESRINIIDAGSPDAIEAAFRAGKGDVLHMQGPAPQQLELEVSKASDRTQPRCIHVALLMNPAFRSSTLVPNHAGNEVLLHHRRSCCQRAIPSGGVVTWVRLLQLSSTHQPQRNTPALAHCQHASAQASLL
jgi:hypothetical protein